MWFQGDTFNVVQHTDKGIVIEGGNIRPPPGGSVEWLEFGNGRVLNGAGVAANLLCQPRKISEWKNLDGLLCVKDAWSRCGPTQSSHLAPATDVGAIRLGKVQTSHAERAPRISADSPNHW